MARDHDCFNGKSSVGPKYDRLDIDFEMVNKRDFGHDEDEDDEPEEPYRHKLDWEYIDETGEDVFDRIGIHVFGGGGFVSNLYWYMVRPSL